MMVSAVGDFGAPGRGRETPEHVDREGPRELLQRVLRIAATGPLIPALLNRTSKRRRVPASMAKLVRRQAVRYARPGNRSGLERCAEALDMTLDEVHKARGARQPLSLPTGQEQHH